MYRDPLNTPKPSRKASVKTREGGRTVGSGVVKTIIE